MIKATEAAMITLKNMEMISTEMKEYISNRIVHAATQGRTRVGFMCGSNKEYCFAVAKWVADFGYSTWFDNNTEPTTFWIGWNAQVEDLRKRG